MNRSKETLLLDQEVEKPRTLRGLVNAITHTRVYEYTALASNLAVVGVGSNVATESFINGNPVSAALGAAFATYSAFTLQEIAVSMGQCISREQEERLQKTRSE